ncbi:unnamed protein product [Effrenium voratum]|nr:unnamed protein product [Effrenium voratum]
MDEEDVGESPSRLRLCGLALEVAQTVLKRRDRNLKAQAKRAEEIKRRKENERKYVRGKVRILKAEQLLKNSLNRIKDQKRLKYVKNKSQAKTAKPVSKGRVLAVCRNGRKSPSAEVKKLLHHMRLRTRHTMTFLPNNEDTAKKLQTVRAYVFWGVPSFKSVFTVVHKKAVFFDREAQTKVARPQGADAI